MCPPLTKAEVSIKDSFSKNKLQLAVWLPSTWISTHLGELQGVLGYTWPLSYNDPMCGESLVLKTSNLKLLRKLWQKD